MDGPREGPSVTDGAHFARTRRHLRQMERPREAAIQGKQIKCGLLEVTEHLEFRVDCQ